MDIVVLLFLTSGLFLGWSLGANDAANVFGTAVGTRMVAFTTAAVVCSIFIVLGAVFSGTGAAHTLGKLGAVNALGGSFMAAMAAAFTVYWMTKLGLPVSTSQAVVGAILGWNIFSGSITDMNALLKILGTWVACPLLAAFIAAPLSLATEAFLSRAKFHVFRIDAYTRIALILAGAFGSYALGANNIANVMGVFVPSSPFTDFNVGELFRVTSIQQLFLLGAIAIAVGVFTYSKKVMLTVGGGLMPLSPVMAWVVVVSHSIVLFLFASEGLEHLLASNGLPTIPLVPVSSSQAVVGAVIGIGLMRNGGRNIDWRVLGRISGGWVTTPVISAVFCFVALFFLQNVFNQQVYSPVSFVLSEPVVMKLEEKGISPKKINELIGQRFETGSDLLSAIKKQTSLSTDETKEIILIAQVSQTEINAERLDVFTKDAQRTDWISQHQIDAVWALKGAHFEHKWMLQDALIAQAKEWRPLPSNKVNKLFNKGINQRFEHVYRSFSVKE